LTAPLPGPQSDDFRIDNNVGRLSLHELEDYYSGSQPLHFLLPGQDRRSRPPVINIPRLVVDSIEDRLDVEGFRMGGSDDADESLWRIWQANDLDEWSQQCHLDALIHGRSFVLVWADEDRTEVPSISVESAHQIAVEYDPAAVSPLGGRGVVTRAVKRWAVGREEFATLYLPGEIRRVARNVGASRWVERAVPVLNPLGLPPVVPFLNRPTLHHPLGESEMIDVIPVADSINELADTMLVTARYYATPRRWATGVDLGGGDAQIERSREVLRQVWSQAERDRVWTSDSPNTSFGQFPEASLDNFIGAINMLTARAAALSGLPPHYFGQAGDNPASADALRSSESALVKRARRKQRVFGGSWERVMRLALLVRDGAVPDDALSMETIWASAETPTVAQKADAAVKLKQAGLVTDDVLLEDLGYTPEQRRRIAQDKADAALGPVRAQLDEAERLQQQGLSQQAAFAAVGLLQAAAAIGQQP
jgi:hypothetical protein